MLPTHIILFVLFWGFGNACFCIHEASECLRRKLNFSWKGFLYPQVSLNEKRCELLNILENIFKFCFLSLSNRQVCYVWFRTQLLRKISNFPIKLFYTLCHIFCWISLRKNLIHLPTHGEHIAGFESKVIRMYMELQSNSLLDEIFIKGNTNNRSFGKWEIKC